MIRVSSLSSKSSRFIREAATHISETQAAVISLLDGAGLEGARPTDVGRRLGLDKSLAWKVAKFADATDLVQAAKYIPGSHGIEITLRAAATKGVAVSRINAVRTADQALRDFVRRQAGDRRSFEAMLAAGGRVEKLELEERRDFFRSGSAIWGVRARVQMLALFLKPSSADNTRIDVAQMSAMIDFERLRPDVPWIIRRLWVSDKGEHGAPPTQMRREPLDPTGVRGRALPLVPEFCSHPLPNINQFAGSDGVLYDEIAPGPVGRTGAVTCVTGEIYRAAAPLAWSPDNTFGRYELNLRTPVEYAMFDLFVHKSLTHFGEFEQGVYSLIENRPPVGVGTAHEHPMYPIQAASRLGEPTNPHAARIPDYERMIDLVMDRFDRETVHDFRGYRLELEYPPIPTCVTMSCAIRQE